MNGQAKQITAGNIKEQRQVESVLLLQSQSLGVLLDRIAELRERINGVLRECPSAKGECCNRTALVPLAEFVRNNTDKVETCTEMITDMLERLEIG